MTRIRSTVAIWALILLALYVTSHLLVIHHFPLFIDEGIHIHMARALSGQPGQGLFDGKWLTIQIFALATRLPLDPLLATRSVAMLFGLATAFACFLIGRELFSLREGVISASTYVILPFTLIYNSLALTDSFQTAFGAYVVLSSILVVRAGKLRHVAFLFGALITAILAKLTGVFFLSIPLVAALIPVPGRLRYQALLRIAPAVLGVLALLVGLWLEGLLFVEGVTGKIQGGSEVFGRLLANTGGAASWLYDLLTPPIAVLTLLALILPLVFERNRADLFLSAVLLLEIVPYVIVAHVWFPRYLLFVTVPVSLLVGRLLSSVWERIGNVFVWKATAAIASVLTLVGWPRMVNWLILTDLPKAPLPEIERVQFVSGWPSGYGLVELAEYLGQRSRQTPGGINVVRLKAPEPVYLGLDLYLKPSSAIVIYSTDRASLVDELSRLGRTQRPTFLVMSVENRQRWAVPATAQFILQCGDRVWSYVRTGGISGLAVYQVDNCLNPRNVR
jgi:hypothetical protein